MSLVLTISIIAVVWFVVAAGVAVMIGGAVRLRGEKERISLPGAEDHLMLRGAEFSGAARVLPRGDR